MAASCLLVLGSPDAMVNRQKQELSEKDRLTISAKALPVDLLISIFSRLPVKSIARFRCVSKQWASLLRRRDFTDLFMKMSSARPRLLIAVQLNGTLLFFSMPQPLNPDKNTSPLVAERHTSFPTEDSFLWLSCLPVCGWLSSPVCKGENPVIRNPSTGQYITLPKVLPPTGIMMVENHLGYDPIDKLHKVLHVFYSTYRVLTLTTGELSWRTIECSIPHFPSYGGICINGVLHYVASWNGGEGLVCFNVRSEKFTFIPVDNKSFSLSYLINFNGKLGVVLHGKFIARTTKSLELWVLEDVENEKWSKDVYVLPPLWESTVGRDTSSLYVVGMTGTGEILFAPRNKPGSYFFFYNVVRNTVVRVKIELGVLAYHEVQRIYTFVEHVEDVKLI